MAMNGVDVASYQATLSFNNIAADFAMIKATQGVTYVNPYCDTHFQQLKAKGKKRGVYHFANHGDAIQEADFFVNNIQGYVGDAILCLDWEGSFVADVAWAKAWLDRVYARTGVKPIIYMSEYVVNTYNWSSVVAADYGLWAAKYSDYEIDNNYDMSQAGAAPNVKWWDFYIMWQWTSSGRVNGYAGNLDCDIFYGTEATWDAYAGNHNITLDQLKSLYNELLGRDPDQAGIDHYVGHYSVDFTRQDLLNSGERRAYLAAQQAAADAAAQAAAQAAAEAQAKADAEAKAKAEADAKAAQDAEDAKNDQPQPGDVITPSDPQEGPSEPSEPESGTSDQDEPKNDPSGLKKLLMAIWQALVKFWKS